MTETVKTYLRPIDRDGLLAFAEKGRNNPNARGTNKVHTVMEGQYRSLSSVGDHAAVVVDEGPDGPGQRPATSAGSTAPAEPRSACVTAPLSSVFTGFTSTTATPAPSATNGRDAAGWIRPEVPTTRARSQRSSAS